jgi:hypothetical protein
MEPGTKKKLIIGGSILVVAGVGGYFLWKYLKNKKEEEAKKKQAELDAAAAAAAASKSQSSQTTQSYTSSIPAGTDILDFQKFANSKGEKLSEDGKAGPKTDYAWSKLGSDYQKSKASDPMLESAIAHLVSLGFNGDSLRSGFNKDFVISWATANKAGLPTFTFNGKTYDAKKGTATTVATTGETAIGKLAYPKGEYSNVRSSASAASGAFDNTFIGQVNSPNAIGKIKNLTFGADKFRWYEVDILTPLAASTKGLSGHNPYAKTGWVREDSITIK